MADVRAVLALLSFIVMCIKFYTLKPHGTDLILSQGLAMSKTEGSLAFVVSNVVTPKTAHYDSQPLIF